MKKGKKVYIIMAFLLIVACLIAAITNTVNAATIAIVFGVGMVLIFGVYLWQYYKDSNYGGKFHQRYPDSHA